MSILRQFTSRTQLVWWWLRQVFGDADYENYLRRAPQAPMSAAEFYLDRLRRKHSRINRCC